jgi:hypothetical protein
LAEEETIERIRHHKEVESLTEEKEVKIAPPSAQIQSMNDNGYSTRDKSSQE